MTQKFEKLKALLKELFQLDQPDLDFGLYRIMHAKSAEVTQFLDKDLLPQVSTRWRRTSVPASSMNIMTARLNLASLSSFIISNTPSHTMRLLWAVDKAAMDARNILFQEEDKATYVREMMERIVAVKEPEPA